MIIIIERFWSNFGLQRHPVAESIRSFGRMMMDGSYPVVTFVPVQVVFQPTIVPSVPLPPPSRANFAGRNKRPDTNQKQRRQCAEAFKKTTLCRYFPRCHLGDTCMFAHHYGELRQRPNTTKTKMCAGFFDGRCRLPADECGLAWVVSGFVPTSLLSLSLSLSLSFSLPLSLSIFLSFSVFPLSLSCLPLLIPLLLLLVTPPVPPAPAASCAASPAAVCAPSASKAPASASFRLSSLLYFPPWFSSPSASFLRFSTSHPPASSLAPRVLPPLCLDLSAHLRLCHGPRDPGRGRQAAVAALGVGGAKRRLSGTRCGRLQGRRVPKPMRPPASHRRMGGAEPTCREGLRPRGPKRRRRQRERRNGQRERAFDRVDQVAARQPDPTSSL